MTALGKLENIIIKNNSLLCIGLDNDCGKIPEFLEKFKNPVLEFNRIIIECTKDLVCAYKFNNAFYEILIKNGLKTLYESVKSVPDDILTIMDAKIGDTGNTAEIYAKTYFERIGADSITLNPYMGYDSIEPFVKYSDKLIFVLALTSNPGSVDFQTDIKDIRDSLSFKVIGKVLNWNNISGNLGLIVGATHTGILDMVFRSTGTLPVLLMGIETQGVDLKKSIKTATSSGGHTIFNVSRRIIFKSEEKNFQDSVRAEAKRFRLEINSNRMDNL